MILRVLAAIFLGLSMLPAFAQPNPDTVWTATIPGLADERIYDLNVLPDGYLIAGRMTINQDYQTFVGRLSSWGSLVWTRLWGGLDADVIKAMVHTADDNYLFVGETMSFGMGSTDILLIGADFLCDSMWAQVYGGPGTEWANAAEPTFDGGYIIAGATNTYGLGLHDFYVLKTTATGALSWVHTYGTERSEDAYGVCQTPDSGYAVFGTTQSSVYPFAADLYIVRLEPNGDTLWTRHYGSSYDDVIYSAHLTSDHGFILAGYESFDGDVQKDVFVMKLDSAGGAQWVTHCGGVGDQIAYSVQQTSDHGYILAGYTLPLGASHRSVYMVKYTGAGHQQWEKTFPCTIRQEAHVVKETPEDGGYIVAGFSSAHAADGDLFVLKTGPDPSLAAPHPSRPQPEVAQLSAFPNPFNAHATLEYTLPAAGPVSLTLYDPTGRTVRVLERGPEERGLHRVYVDGSSLAAGLYLVRLTAPRLTQTQKLLLIK
jgi:hypothetical protein